MTSDDADGLSRLLRSTDFEDGEALTRVTRTLATLLDSGRAAIVLFTRGVRAPAVERVAAHGLDASELEGRLRRVVAEHPHGFALWDPMRLGPSEASRAIAVRARFGDARLQSMPVHQQVLVPLGAGDCDQLRVVIGERGPLVAWVGVMRERSYTDAEVRHLQQLVPAFEQRLRVERQWTWADRALEATLDYLPTPALVVRSDGVILELNRAAQRAIDEDRAGVAEQLEAAVRGERSCFELSRLELADQRPVFLAVRSTTSDLSARVQQAAGRWRLTARQTEVLALLARGMANKAIADALGCAEATVEVHVRAILDRSGLESRACVIAKVLG